MCYVYWLWSELIHWMLTFSLLFLFFCTTKIVQTKTDEIHKCDWTTHTHTHTHTLYAIVMWNGHRAIVRVKFLHNTLRSLCVFVLFSLALSASRIRKLGNRPCDYCRPQRMLSRSLVLYIALGHDSSWLCYALTFVRAFSSTRIALLSQQFARERFLRIN